MIKKYRYSGIVGFVLLAVRPTEDCSFQGLGGSPNRVILSWRRWRGVHLCVLAQGFGGKPHLEYYWVGWRWLGGTIKKYWPVLSASLFSPASRCFRRQAPPRTTELGGVGFVGHSKSTHKLIGICVECYCGLFSFERQAPWSTLCWA